MIPLDPQKQQEFAVEVVQKLRAAGFDAYWAGGCVRDHLLGGTPKDYDIATSAVPNEIRKLFGERRTLAIGAAFGVITVRGKSGAGQIEVATFREDSHYSDGRRPDSVRFGTAEADAARRDFTINGMFFDPLENRVLDYVGGQKDLENQIVRAIGNPLDRIAEDKLRMLRAVRFAAKFNFALDSDTLEAIRRVAADVLIVSAERIAAEMRAMLLDARRSTALRLLQLAGLLTQVLPELSEIAPTKPAALHLDRPPQLFDPWGQTLAVLDRLESPPFPLALAATLRTVARRGTIADVAQRWKLPKKDAAIATWLLASHGDLAGAPREPWSRIQPLLIHQGARQLVDLRAALASVHLADAADVDFCLERLDWPADRLDPPPLVTGDDLAGLEIPKGRVYARLLRELRTAQLDDRIHSKEEALELAQRMRAHDD